MTPVPDAAVEVLAALEERLDPARPEAEGEVSVLAYGEVSVALRVTSLPGLVCKRMSGFRDEAAVERYRLLVAEYLDALTTAGVRPVGTSVVVLRPRDRAPVAYLLQRELPAESLGHRLLADATDDRLAGAVDRVLDLLLRVHRASSTAPGGLELAVDGQLSNWSFPPGGGDPADLADPVLVDVGTPFMRRDGRHLFDTEVFLSAVPPVLRAYYRRKRAVEDYLDDYFVPRLVAVDLLGNFHKEGHPERIPLALGRVNAWLSAHAGEVGAADPVTLDEIDGYYRHDAQQLALFLRLRRLDRFVRTSVLRGRYDFVLPGPVRR